MKKLVIILLVIFLTGCNVKYDLTITDKEEIKENFKVYVDNEEILKEYNSVDEYLDYYSSFYIENQGKQTYDIKTRESNPQSYFDVKNTYKNLDEYITSSTFLTMFNNALIDRTGNYVSFTTSINTFLQSIRNDNLVSEHDADKSFEIRVKFYNEVTSSNADYIDKKNNIYVWNVNKNTTKDYMYFKIGPKVKYDIVIKDYIQTNLTTIIIIGACIILLAGTGGYIYIKSKKNNEV